MSDPEPVAGAASDAAELTTDKMTQDILNSKVDPLDLLVVNIRINKFAPAVKAVADGKLETLYELTKEDL